MALISKTFGLDMTPGAMPPVIHVSEYDVNREFTIYLQNAGNAFTPATGTTVKIEGTLNGCGFSEDATISGNAVTFTLTESMTASAGKAWVKVKLTNSDEPVSTCAFILAVDRAGVEAGTVIGASGFEQQIVDAVDDYLDTHSIDPMIVTYNAASSAFSSTYAAINTAWNAGRQVFCDITCGNSVFRAELKRFHAEEGYTSWYSFEYVVYQVDDVELWCGRLSVNANNLVSYSENSIQL